jgi:hypothetical protein
VALALLLCGGNAFAQACCTSTGGGEFSAVGPGQFAVVAAQVSYERALGSYSDRGDYHPALEASVDDFIVALGGGVRPGGKSLQLHGSVPARLQRRGFPGLDSDVAVGFGDATLEARWTALEDRLDGISSEPQAWMPSLDVLFGGTAPTGRSPEDGTRLTGVDVTGDGAWKLTAGLRVTKFVTSRHSLGLAMALSHRFAQSVAREDGAVRRAPGPETIGRAFYLYVPSTYWSFGGAASVRLGDAAREDGQLLPGSATRRTRLSVHATYALDFPEWEITSALTTDGWWQGAGRNVPFAGPSLSLTLRRQFL